MYISQLMLAKNCMYTYSQVTYRQIDEGEGLTCVTRCPFNSDYLNVLTRPPLRCLNKRILKMTIFICQFSSVQSLSCVLLFATPWTAARQASLSITKSQSLLKFMSIESVMPSNHLILCRPLLLMPSIFPNIRVFSNESVLCIKWRSIRVSASASVLPMNIQD